MTHLCKLLYGDDRRNPDSELNLNQLSAGEIRVSGGGLVPTAGPLNQLYSGTSSRFDGEFPIADSRGNMRLELKYNVMGASLADVARIQRQIQQYARYAALRNEGRGEAVWLEYRWNSEPVLDDLPRPTWGQLNYYARVLSIDTRWPDGLGDPMLVNNFIEGVLCTLVCEPYWYGLEQTALNATTTIDTTDSGGTIGSVDLSGAFTIAGWYEWASDVDYFMSYADGTDTLSGRCTANSVVMFAKISAAVVLEASVTVTGKFHWAIIQDASTLAFYINAVEIGSTTAQDFGTGTLTIGGTPVTPASLKVSGSATGLFDPPTYTI